MTPWKIILSILGGAVPLGANGCNPSEPSPSVVLRLLNESAFTARVVLELDAQERDYVLAPGGLVEELTDCAAAVRLTRVTLEDGEFAQVNELDAGALAVDQNYVCGDHILVTVTSGEVRIESADSSESRIRDSFISLF